MAVAGVHRGLGNKSVSSSSSEVFNGFSFARLLSSAGSRPALLLLDKLPGAADGEEDGTFPVCAGDFILFAAMDDCGSEELLLRGLLSLTCGLAGKCDSDSLIPPTPTDGGAEYAFAGNELG